MRRWAEKHSDQPVCRQLPNHRVFTDCPHASIVKSVPCNRSCLALYLVIAIWSLPFCEKYFLCFQFASLLESSFSLEWLPGPAPMCYTCVPIIQPPYKLPSSLLSLSVFYLISVWQRPRGFPCVVLLMLLTHWFLPLRLCVRACLSVSLSVCLLSVRDLAFSPSRYLDLCLFDLC